MYLCTKTLKCRLKEGEVPCVCVGGEGHHWRILNMIETKSKVAIVENILYPISILFIVLVLTKVIQHKVKQQQKSKQNNSSKTKTNYNQ